MTLSEKSAYLKGLMDGLKLDTDKNEGKLIAAIIDMLSDVAENVADLEDVVDCISDELDCIEEDLDNIDEYLLDDEDDDEDEDDEDYEDDFGDEDEFDFGDETLYEVKCPTCGEVITIDEEMLDEGATTCPNCGERSEIFSHGSAAQASKQFDVPFLGEIPLSLAIREGGDTGKPAVTSDLPEAFAQAFRDVARNLAGRISVEAFAQA